jgi:hypothetical protein
MEKTLSFDQTIDQSESFAPSLTASLPMRIDVDVFTQLGLRIERDSVSFPLRIVT